MAGVEEDLDLSEEFVSCDEEPTPSSSGPVEEVVDVVSSDTETDAGVPEIDVNGLLSDAIVKKFRQRVVEELKDAYRGEGTTELVQAVNTIVDLYARAYQHKAGARFVQLLLLDLERRLYFMIDNENYLVGRLRTLSVIARFATGLVHKEATHSDVLDFLIDFIKKNEYNSSPASRALVCYLAGEVLVSSVGAPIIKQLYVYDVNMEVEDDDEEYPVCLSLDAFTKIYSVLESRSQDKYPNVRKEAIRAIGHVQDRDIWGEYQALVEVQPYEVVVGHIIDESPDVRTIAIKSLLISESDRVRDLVSIAVTDPDWNVQKEAYLRICQDLHIGAFSVEERMSLLETVCYHKELLMRESAIKLITSWATQLCREIQKKGLDPDGDGGKDIPMSMYARTPLYILNYLDVLGNTELSQTVMLHLFYMAAIRYPDIATTQAYVLLIKDENAVLNRQNFRSIMFRKLSLADIAHRIFFWRMFAIYGQRASKDAAEWAEVTHQLFPSLRPFCEFVLEFVTFISKKFEGEEMEAYKIFAITELLKIAKLLDRDVVGVASWRNMLSSILTSQVIPTDKNLIDLCVCDLFAYHFPKKDDVSVFFSGTACRPSTRSGPGPCMSRVSHLASRVFWPFFARQVSRLASRKNARDTCETEDESLGFGATAMTGNSKFSLCFGRCADAYYV
uniref:Cnd3 domain-containing protein n=1 Tax=Steinernema glaseri TaxID=37863 RepID=A0A1I7ZT99_9BILA